MRWRCPRARLRPQRLLPLLLLLLLLLRGSIGGIGRICGRARAAGSVS
jgi:hypothetical protein